MGRSAVADPGEREPVPVWLMRCCVGAASFLRSVIRNMAMAVTCGDAGCSGTVGDVWGVFAVVRRGAVPVGNVPRGNGWGEPGALVANRPLRLLIRR
jgi:hypothetical protein